MKILFVNPIGTSIHCLILDSKKRTVIDSEEIRKTGNDFEIVPGIFVDLVKKHSPGEIWCITGPGGFTLMRIVTLILNSIAYNSPGLILRSSHFFDLIGGDDHSPILEANRFEYLVRDGSGKDILIPKGELSLGKYTGYIEDISLHWYTPYTPSVSDIFRVFQEKGPETRLSPLYIKSPHITIGSKKTSLQHS